MKQTNESASTRLASLVLAEPKVIQALANYEAMKFADYSFRDMGLAAIELYAAEPDSRGWVRYPLISKVGNLVENLDLIQRLLGSAMYEQKQKDGILFIRRAV